MINLLPWREQIFFRKKLVAISILTIIYTLFFLAISVVIVKLQQKNRQAHQMLYQLQIQTQGQFTKADLLNRVNQSQFLLLANQIIWQRFYFFQKMMHFILVLPKDLMLLKLSCVVGECEMTVASEWPQTIMQTAKYFVIQSMKQGGCPLCYQAKLVVTW